MQTTIDITAWRLKLEERIFKAKTPKEAANACAYMLEKTAENSRMGIRQLSLEMQRYVEREAELLEKMARNIRKSTKESHIAWRKENLEQMRKRKVKKRKEIFRNQNQ